VEIRRRPPPTLKAELPEIAGQGIRQLLPLEHDGDRVKRKPAPFLGL
jgi:hypothetical protein